MSMVTHIPSATIKRREACEGSMEICKAQNPEKGKLGSVLEESTNDRVSE